MLKKPASGVLASLRSSTLRRAFSEVGSTIGAFPFAKIHPTGELAHTKCGMFTSSPLRSLAALPADKARLGAPGLGG